MSFSKNAIETVEKPFSSRNSLTLFEFHRRTSSCFSTLIGGSSGPSSLGGGRRIPCSGLWTGEPLVTPPGQLVAAPGLFVAAPGLFVVVPGFLVTLPGLTDVVVGLLVVA